MSNEFLSQDEVDALLKGVDTEGESAATEAGDEVRPYNLATHERFVRGRMPTLDNINERFGIFLKTTLFNFVRCQSEIGVGPIQVIKYNEFIQSVGSPTSFNVFHMKPLRGSALIVFDPPMVFSMVDNLFGGGGRISDTGEGREFGPTEQRIIQRALALALQDYQRSWTSVYPLTCEAVRSETSSQFVAIASPNDVVVVTTFHVEFGPPGEPGERVPGKAAFHICIPYSTIEPIRELLYPTKEANQFEPDNRWLQMLATEIQSAEVDLVANLFELPVTVHQLLTMQVGDVLGIEIPQTVQAGVDGIPIFDCKFGALNGQYAIKINRILASQDNKSAGEANV